MYLEKNKIKIRLNELNILKQLGYLFKLNPFFIVYGYNDRNKYIVISCNRQYYFKSLTLQKAKKYWEASFNAAQIFPSEHYFWPLLHMFIYGRTCDFYRDFLLLLVWTKSMFPSISWNNNRTLYTVIWQLNNPSWRNQKLAAKIHEQLSELLS